jgi:glutathione S-transferase
MKLYTHWSFSPQKVSFALRELGSSAEEVPVDLLRGEQKTPEFAAINPMQKLPVLEDDGLVLWESNAILAYLGERERALWPEDARGRADALRWMFFEARYLADSVGPLWFFESIAPALGIPADAALPDGTVPAERIARGRKELERPLAIADQHFSSSCWVLGDAFSLADCSLGMTLSALAASRFDWTPYPDAYAYVARIRERAAWRPAHPHP